MEENKEEGNTENIAEASQVNGGNNNRCRKVGRAADMSAAARGNDERRERRSAASDELLVREDRRGEQASGTDIGNSRKLD